MKLERISTVNMTREEWLEKRRILGIGGSEAAAVVGLHPFQTRMTLWGDKRGLIPPAEDNERMRVGRDLEEYVAKRFCEATGKKVKRENAILINPEYRFAFADVDRRIIGENAVLECKTTSAFNRSDFENGEIPAYYFCQCQHYMAVTGCDRAYLAILVLGQAFYHFEIDRDPEQIDALMHAEKEFWENNVKTGAMPDPAGKDAETEFISNMFPGKESDLVLDLTPVDRILDQIDMLNRMIADANTEREALRQKLMVTLGDNTAGENNHFRVTYRPTARTSVDIRRLKAELPDIVNQYSQITETRQLRIYKKKEKAA